VLTPITIARRAADVKPERRGGTLSLWGREKGWG
jgi:hypothetical protein